MTLERKAFCALLTHPKTQERIMGMMSTGKPRAQLIREDTHESKFKTPTSLPPPARPSGVRSRGSSQHAARRPAGAGAAVARWPRCPALDPKAIEDLICGCAIPEAQQGLNMARVGAVLAGLPHSVGGITVNRFCASGLSAVQMAADRIRVGEADVMIAAGVESMSMVPMMGNAPSACRLPCSHNDENIGIAYGMGLTAEKVANQWKVSREAQDAFALESHHRALAAQARRRLRRRDHAACRWWTAAPTWKPVKCVEKRRTVNLDEGARADTSMEGLAKLKTVFAARGSVTAGNSSQTSDGAGALMLASEKAVKQFGLKPLARFVSFASARCAAAHHGHWPD